MVKSGAASIVGCCDGIARGAEVGEESGEIAVGLERQAIEAGSIVVIPPGTPHQLFNDSDETLKVLSVVSPAFEASEFNLQHSITGT